MKLASLVTQINHFSFIFKMIVYINSTEKCAILVENVDDIWKLFHEKNI